MNNHQLETDLAIAKKILTEIAFAKQLCSGSGSYMSNYLREMCDRTAVQISLLQEILQRCQEEKRERKAS